MNTKEAIELVKKLYWAADGEKMNLRLEDRDNINRLLKRGEKYENLFNEVEESFQNDLDSAEWVDDIKQKYFPKE